jgi:valyl-tRNA synthetase
MHPFLPFVTEELWHGMGYAEDMPELQGGKTISYAPWPKPLGEEFRQGFGLDETDDQFVNAKYELVTKARNLRRESNISAAKKLRFILRPAGNLPDHERTVLKLLLNAEAVDIGDSQTAIKKGTPSIQNSLGELFLPLEGVIDVEAERARLTKELSKTDAEIVKVKEKLANPNFAQKVPPAVLDEHQKRLADWEAKKAGLLRSLDGLSEI